MIPGLAIFYAGMVRGKNVLGTIMQSFIMISVITIEWVYLGYSMSFGPDFSGIIGNLSWAGLNGVGTAPHANYAPTVPHLVFMIYQCMFAVITPALITGAFAERVRFAPFILFSLLWSILVYNPVCHWIWGGGWLAARGVLDFAGGLVVHLTCGVAALVSCVIIGPRVGYGRRMFLPHNLPMTLIGTGLLWFGWFGFNGGSAPGRQRNCGHGLRGHAYRGHGRNGHMERGGMVAQWQTHLHLARPPEPLPVSRRSRPGQDLSAPTRQ